MAKYIFITGGVVSSVGKGIAAASIGTLLKSRGLSVASQKLDPYLNVDPGTMSPYQHGEVFVTEDGAETDLDLGNYERFIDVNLTRESNVTSGQIYNAVTSRERRGDFLGGTIQVVPHVTNEIKSRFRAIAEKTGADVILCEIGGTVGDIEGQPFLEAIRQMRNDVGRESVLYIHVTLLPYLGSTGELKTKPTQHSVGELRRIGIQPDIIICRSDYPVADEVRRKISLFCDVEERAVFSLTTVDTIYEVPIVLEEAGIDQLVVDKLQLKAGTLDLGQWREMVTRLKQPHEPVNITLVGKYVELKDAYFSVRESLCFAALYHDRELCLNWVHSEDLADGDIDHLLGQAQGIIVPGGFGLRGIEGMIMAANYARVNNIPYFGLCLGLQVMVIEFARNVMGMAGANSTEFDAGGAYPVIDLMPDQHEVDGMGGTMRLGNWDCKLTPGTLAGTAYDNGIIKERHRHRYEFNNVYRETMAAKGMVYSGMSPDGRLVEICELSGHPWMLSCQFHPEFGSRPNRPHPLFREFIGAAREVFREGAQPPLPLTE
jgi:CTP synthase